jgi:hypothetical protein
MFKVYGVTQETAKAAAEKQFKRLPIKEQLALSPSDAEARINGYAAEHFEKMKPVVIGKPLSTPEFAQELIDLTKKTTKSRLLHIRINAPQINNAGGFIINNRTFKPAMSWQRWDSSVDYAALFERMEEAREKAMEDAA